MEKNRIEIAKRLGINVKIDSETPGIYFNDGKEKREIILDELFPEFKELNQHSYTLTSESISISSRVKGKGMFISSYQSFSESDLLIGAS